MVSPHLSPATLVLASVLFAVACERDPSLTVDEPDAAPAAILEDDFGTRAAHHGSGSMLQLGEPLENPYHVDTVRRAYAGLVGRSPESVTEAVPVTHYYVWFLPATLEEVDLLTDEADLELFDYPLLYEIASEGNWYRDPAVQEGYPTWMYTVVPVDYAYPAVDYEVIDALHMPDEDGQDATPAYEGDLTVADVEGAAHALVAEAAIVGGAGGELESRGKKYRPSGRIRVDEYTLRRGYEGIRGLEGIKVRARRVLSTVRTSYRT